MDVFELTKQYSSKELITYEEIDKYASEYGNAFCELDRNDIDDLLNGKVLYFENSEYGCFVRCKRKEGAE